MSNGASRIADFIKKALFVDFIKGLAITLRYNVSKSITLRYPDEEKWASSKTRTAGSSA